MICWPIGWGDVHSHERDELFLRELQREIADNPEHPLFNKPLRIISYRDAWDDFIFQIIGEPVYVYVHLTWQCETNPTFPWCKFLENDDALNAFLIDMSPEE